VGIPISEEGGYLYMSEETTRTKQLPVPGKDMDSIMENLETGVAVLFTSDRYQEYLRTMAKFHNYSFNNTLLIAMQRPDATLVTSYKNWQSMGRQVMKGEKGITITSQMAGLMCAAILSDTLMFRSPTCTQIDREAALRLAEIAEVKVEELASAMFQAGSNFDNKTEEEILNQDFKIFHAEDVSFGVAQISAMGRTELDKVQERIEPKLEQMMGEKQIQMIFVMLTDILNESTYLIYRGADASQLVAAAYNCEPSDQGIMLENVVSRKKQLIPALINTLAERKM